MHLGVNLHSGKPPCDLLDIQFENQETTSSATSTQVERLLPSVWSEDLGPIEGAKGLNSCR